MTYTPEAPQTHPQTPEDLRNACAGLAAHSPAPLLIVDVDEVLALFCQGFNRFLRLHGHELRMDSFALFGNIFPIGGVDPADKIVGKGLFDIFFAEGCGDLVPSPAAAESLARVARVARVVVLTNAPQTARTLRGAWLVEHGLDYPLVVNAGPKGAAVRALADAGGGKTAFVDDLLSNLDSVAQHAPDVETFQMVADPHLRPLAPSAPYRHRRVDDWPDLTIELERFFA